MKKIFFSLILILASFCAQSQESFDSVDCEIMVDCMIRKAVSFLGTPYVWAANGPDSFDCSGFVHYVYGTAGIQVKRNSKLLSEEGFAISTPEIQKGDLVFFVSGTPPERDITHVGIAISSYDYETRNFQFIHANSSDGCVAISNYNEPRFIKSYWGARRVVPCL